MLFYPSDQMSDCFTNVNVICITQTFEFINYIGQQTQGSTAFREKKFTLKDVKTILMSMQ